MARGFGLRKPTEMEGRPNHTPRRTSTHARAVPPAAGVPGSPVPELSSTSHGHSWRRWWGRFSLHPVHEAWEDHFSGSPRGDTPAAGLGAQAPPPWVPVDPRCLRPEVHPHPPSAPLRPHPRVPWHIPHNNGLQPRPCTHCRKQPFVWYPGPLPQHPHPTPRHCLTLQGAAKWSAPSPLYHLGACDLEPVCAPLSPGPGTWEPALTSRLR